jgi:ABC-type sugar transport system permease subunit
MVQALLGTNVNDKSVVMGKFVYMYGYESYDPRIGYSYAAAIIMLIITTALSLGANKIMSKGDEE